jgi:hypothetical protein
MKQPEDESKRSGPVMSFPSEAASLAELSGAAKDIQQGIQQGVEQF